MATHSSILAWKTLQRSLADHGLWGHKESDMTERVCMHARAHTHTHTIK